MKDKINPFRKARLKSGLPISLIAFKLKKCVGVVNRYEAPRGERYKNGNKKYLVPSLSITMKLIEIYAKEGVDLDIIEVKEYNDGVK